jgi:hypothetical protein
VCHKPYHFYSSHIAAAQTRRVAWHGRDTRCKASNMGAKSHEACSRLKKTEKDGKLEFADGKTVTL